LIHTHTHTHTTANCRNNYICDDGFNFLGAYDDEEAAGHAYDLAALKYWGQDTILNFPVNLDNSKLFFFLKSFLSWP